MLFNSFEYLVFFLVVLALSWIVAKRLSLRLWVLLLASYYFYGTNNHWYLLLILFSTAVDYVAGLQIAACKELRQRKFWLITSLVVNLGALGLFKYADFFRGSVVTLAGALGWELSWVDLNVFLPVGISFYTFQSMSYSIDVYRQRREPERSWLRFALYISFFPQLIAGPIVRGTEFLPQLARQPRLIPRDFECALFRIMTGLFKKIVLADFLAAYADAAFNSPDGVSGIAAWLGVFAFSFQIYFDFSGYTDIAIGSAKLLGYDLPENFQRPYIAQSFSDFWRRWHMSLSTWLRDYLYIPLGGSRMATNAGVVRNLMITMALCGLWHGASWTFVLWGVMHGLLLCVERMTKRNKAPTLLSRPILSLMFFVLFSVSWIPFRANSVGDVVIFCQALLRVFMPTDITFGMIVAAMLIVASWGVQFVSEKGAWRKRFLELPIFAKSAVYAVICAGVLVCNSAGEKPFIYFQF